MSWSESNRGQDPGHSRTRSEFGSGWGSSRGQDPGHGHGQTSSEFGRGRGSSRGQANSGYTQPPLNYDVGSRSRDAASSEGGRLGQRGQLRGPTRHQSGARGNTQNVERKGRIFGFKRLHSFLSQLPEEVIMSIDKDLEEWKKFLESDDLVKFDNLLPLVVQILADKVCCEEVLLAQQQIAILIKSNGDKFIDKINGKCNEINMMGLAGITPARTTNYENFIEVDTSPKTFLTNVQKFGAFVTKKMPEVAVDYLLKIVCSACAAVGEITSQDESWNSLCNDFLVLKGKIQALLLKRSAGKGDQGKSSRDRRDDAFSERERFEMHAMDAPDDFRNIGVIPTAVELRSKEETFLRDNIISGAYNSANHYLDVQFRLLREDFVRPLKKGIQDFLKHKFEYKNRTKKMPIGSIRLYMDVQVIGGELVRDVFVFKLQLSEEIYKNKRINWERSKRLLPGSLLVLTRDDFNSAYFAVVHSRKTEELEKGIVSILWEGPQPEWDRDYEFLMVESDVYLEAFRHTLSILKDLPLENFPMCKFIVGASSDVNPPKYLINCENMIRLPTKDKNSRMMISPLLPEMWPTSEQLELDDKQFAAFQAALTKEFVIIQGPPGTGKTHLGLKIAEVFLRNKKVWKVGPRDPLEDLAEVAVQDLAEVAAQDLAEVAAQDLAEVAVQDLIQNPVKEEMEAEKDDEQPAIVMPPRPKSPIRLESKGPILVVCYTNHALDQFMEGILELLTPEDHARYSYPIIRVGGRSQSKKLEDYSLFSIMRRCRYYDMPDNYGRVKHLHYEAIDKFRFDRSTIITAIMGMRSLQGVVDFTKLNVWDELVREYDDSLWTMISNGGWLGVYDKAFIHTGYNPHLTIRKWFEVLHDSMGKRGERKRVDKVNEIKEQDSDQDEDYDVEEMIKNRVIDEFHLDRKPGRREEENPKLLEYLPYISISQCEEDYHKVERVVEEIVTRKLPPPTYVKLVSGHRYQQLILRNKGRFLRTLFDLYSRNLLVIPDVTKLLERIKSNPDSVNWNDITHGKRWALYFEIVGRARSLLAKKLIEIEKKLIEEQKKVQEIQRYAESHILEKSLVVGMTTTGAAKYNDLVRKMKSKIVIVEEAAEILESHIVTSITKSCEHLILIGDHRQLRPSTTVYELAKNYNLDISLFERMLNNKLNCYQLTVQHRMKPNIANLVVGTIYEELHNDRKVSLYPEVTGVSKNLYFLSHNELEQSDSDSLSKSNKFEANFLASLCRHLILNGYSSDRITVLTTYTGQMFLLKKTFRTFSNCLDVRITCVDNFQGEENDIILLSLVRSNIESKIGFLNIDNRICVALSRAKHGLYIVGNMGILSGKSETWSKIKEKLDSDGLCGPKLTLECIIHDEISSVGSSEEFLDKAPAGGCARLCDTVLSCKHKCVRVCHIEDRTHDETYKCEQACPKPCAANAHPCEEICSKPCPPCVQVVEKTLLCQHAVRVQCHKPVESVDCEVVVHKDLPCGHKEHLACHVHPAKYRCKVEVEKIPSCGHPKTLKCHKEASQVNCKVLMEKVLPCGHSQLVECRFKPEDITCDTIITHINIDCQHEVQIRCGDQKDPNLKCLLPCTIRLTCGHSCTKTCHVLEDPDHFAYNCTKPCAKSCPEGHPCLLVHKCHQECPPCLQITERKIEKCGHTVGLECHDDPEAYECHYPCEKILDTSLTCGHKCQNLCFQPCGPCKVVVKKRIQECRHGVEIACSERPDRKLCTELVPPLLKSACSHQTKVPCGLSQTITPQDSLKYCNEPCAEVFSEETGGCGHTCMGSCSGCLQGRFHHKCQSNCGKIWPCGHVCDFPCSRACPPCKKNCAMKCEHSKCRHDCGLTCQGCAEPCSWSCEHKRCTKKCREMCDRDPCDEPCQLKIKCGHPCIGFCGEPCPLQCRICNHEELTTVFLGYENLQDARFVLLPDCKHAIEVTGLSLYMTGRSGSEEEDMTDSPAETLEINAKRCPLCSTIIGNCRRFNNAIRANMEDVMKVKKKISGSYKEIKATQGTLINKMKSMELAWSETLPVLYKFIKSNLFNVVPVLGRQELRVLPKQVDEMTLASLHFLVNHGAGAVQVLLKVKTDLTPKLQVDLASRYTQLFANVLDRKLPLSRREMGDISCELERLFELHQIYTRRSHENFPNRHYQGTPIYERILEVVLSPIPFTHKMKEEIRTLMKELEEAIRTGLGISEMERKEVLAALERDLGPGHWFKCPNGHIYGIGNCGGANERSICNECKAPIGGENHALSAGNQRAAEMDGSTASAWPTMG